MPRGRLLPDEVWQRRHSSLSYLRQLPVDIIKMDRAFVSELRGPSDGQTIASVIVSLGRSVGMRTVGEGVEEPGQLAALRAAGCGGPNIPVRAGRPAADTADLRS